MDGGADALAATGRPTVLAGTNTFDNQGGTIVRGYVTPNGSPVSECRFEYGPSEAYGQTTACEGIVGSGSEPVEVTMDARELKAGATYHFRLVASNGWGTSESQDSVFVAPAEEAHEACPNAGMAGAGRLPGCRAWEMVSSNAKGGADVSPVSEAVRTADDGSAASFISLSGFGDVIGDGVGFEYMGVRSESPNPGNQGWVTHAITPPQPSANINELASVNLQTHYVDFEGFSSDLNRAVTIATRPVTEEPLVQNLIGNLYLREDLRTPGHGDYRLLDECSVCTSPLPIEVQSSMRFDGATPDYSRLIFESKDNLTADASGGGLKIYEWHEDVVGLVSKAQNGSTVPSATAGGLQGEGTYQSATHHAISSDGSKIFFQNDTSGGVENLYMRLNGTSTVKLNASERTPPAEPALAHYATASQDGSRVFFTSTEPLTDDAPTAGNKLYMYNTTLPLEEPHHLTFLAPNVETVLGASDDGSYVYFISAAHLYGIQQEIYVWHEGSLSFVGTVAPPGTSTTVPYISAGGGLIYVSLLRQGELLASGFKERCSTPECREIFSYRPATHQLECVSCSQSADVVGGEASYEVHIASSGASNSGHSDRPLTSDGRYAFFTSTEALVPNDTNGVFDAYVYDMETGGVSLLSSGESPAGSYFVEATPSGHDAFFVTNDRLVGWDNDNNYDLYDARVDGGFPEPPAPPPGCEGDACQPVPVSFSDPTPASASFSGAGNAKPVGVKAQKRRLHKKSKKRKHHRAAAKKARRGR
ncbi:MAG TPA: hypothetical protein VGY30_05870 [Solirubrobacteraceae bacterium]|jgi:hypothetical protein|nr:hypothetical protein [Solirubrobacteraceae bacterium]